jgi:hypothetical protein
VRQISQVLSTNNNQSRHNLHGRGGAPDLEMKVSLLSAEYPYVEHFRERVTAVAPGRFAASVGIRQGDVLVSFNGRCVYNLDDWNRIQSSLSSGSTVKIEVLCDLFSIRPSQY